MVIMSEGNVSESKTSVQSSCSSHKSIIMAEMDAVVMDTQRVRTVEGVAPLTCPEDSLSQYPSQESYASESPAVATDFVEQQMYYPMQTAQQYSLVPQQVFAYYPGAYQLLPSYPYGIQQPVSPQYSSSTAINSADATACCPTTRTPPTAMYPTAVTPESTSISPTSTSVSYLDEYSYWMYNQQDPSEVAEMAGGDMDAPHIMLEGTDSQPNIILNGVDSSESVPKDDPQESQSAGTSYSHTEPRESQSQPTIITSSCENESMARSSASENMLFDDSMAQSFIQVRTDDQQNEVFELQSNSPSTGSECGVQNVAAVPADYTTPILQQPVDNHFPMVYVSPLGMMAIYLAHSVVVEMTVDKTLRVINQLGGSVASISGRGNRSCIYHQAAKLFQDSTRVDVEIYGGRRAKFNADGVKFQSYSDGEKNYVYLLDGNGVQACPDDSFDDLNYDYSVNILYSSQHGPEVVGLAKQIVNGASHFNDRKGNVVTRVNCTQIQQNLENGEVNLRTGYRHIYIHPTSNHLAVRTSFIKMNANMQGKVWLRRGSRVLQANSRSMLVSDGIIVTGCDHKRQLYVK